MRTDFRYACLLSTVLLLVVSCSALATEFKSGESISVKEGTKTDDELYAFAQSIVISGMITSDLTAAGNEVRLAEEGSVGGSANLAGSSVNVAGKVADNLRAAGSEVTVSGPIGGNAAIAGSSVMLAGSGRIARDLFVAGSQVDVEGSVGRNLRVSADQVTVNAPVGGSVNIQARDVNVGPQAVIKGDLVYTSPMRAKIDPGAQITGKTVYHKGEAQKDVFEGLKWVFWAVGFIALFLVGLVPLTIAPKSAVDISQAAIRNPWLSLLIGFVLLVVTPAAIGVLLFTLVGIPLAVILLVIYLILLYMSRAVIGLAIGRWIFARTGKPEASRYLAFFIGLLVFWILTALPYIGPFISFMGLLLGLGALAWERYTFIKQLRTENRI